MDIIGKIALRTTPELFLPRKIFDKLLFVARQVRPYEVQFLGAVQTISPRKFKILDVFLVSQKVSTASTTMESGAIAQLTAEVENPELVWFWVHSHVDFGTFWSATDLANIESIIRSTGRLLSLVYCCDGRMTARLDVNYNKVIQTNEEPSWAEFDTTYFPTRVTIPEVRVSIENLVSTSERALLLKEIEQKVIRDRETSSDELTAFPEIGKPSRLNYFERKFERKFVSNEVGQVEKAPISLKERFSRFSDSPEEPGGLDEP
jgi:hypothetical protein